MRRCLALAVTTTLVMAAGCGVKSYELRLGKTLEVMRLNKTLDDNLNPPAKGKLETNLIYVRPPKGLSAEPAKTFQLAELEPGKFDLAESFYEKGAQDFHVLARIKRPKAPAGKKAATPAAPEAVRNDFVTDVFQVLDGAYNVNLDPTKVKDDNKRNNKFKRTTFEANDKTVQVYFTGVKSQFETALIFEYPKSDQSNSLVKKIDLCLGSFATGEKARRQFSGGLDEEAGEAGAPAGAAAF